jgi:hypothetical protein
MGYTDKEVHIFMEAVRNRSTKTLNRLSQSDFIDCFSILRLASAAPGNNAGVCRYFVQSPNETQLNLSDTLLLDCRLCKQQLSGRHFQVECEHIVENMDITGVVRTDILLFGLKAAKAVGEIEGQYTDTQH